MSSPPSPLHYSSHLTDSSGLKIDDNEDLFAYDGDKEELARTIGTWGFGANSYNQLGVDSADPCQPTLIETFLSIGPIVSISCGNSFTMMLTATGRLYGVGRNNYYQIGIENTASHKRPMLVEALKNIDIVQVATGHEHTIALASDGRVFGWGRNTQHQLGNTKNTSQQPHQIQALENVKVKKVACGSGYTMVIDCDGNLWGFGQNNSFQIGYSGQLTPQSTPRLISAFQGVKVEAVACGSTHTLVVVSTSDGATQVWGMGSDNCGQLGLATGSNTNAPTPIQSLCSLPIAFAICGAYFSMVRTTDGQVYSFGQNSHGELGLGHTVNTMVPALVPFDVDIVDIALGYYHALFLTEEGRVFGTGQGAHFQNGLQSNALSPEEILKLRDSSVNKLAAGATHGFAFQSSRGAELMPTSNLLMDIEKAFNNQQLSDVVFTVEGKKIFANKFFLSLRCEKFRVQFGSKMSDSTATEIVVKDSKYKHYFAFLRYIYTDRADFPLEDTIDILNLANQHNLQRLVRLCEKQIKRGIDYDNAAYLFQIASMYETPNLKNFCLNYMVKQDNFDRVIKTTAFAKLPKKLILDVLASKPPYVAPINV